MSRLAATRDRRTGGHRPEPSSDVRICRDWAIAQTLGRLGQCHGRQFLYHHRFHIALRGPGADEHMHISSSFVITDSMEVLAALAFPFAKAAVEWGAPSRTRNDTKVCWQQVATDLLQHHCWRSRHRGIDRPSELDLAAGTYRPLHFEVTLVNVSATITIISRRTWLTNMKSGSRIGICNLFANDDLAHFSRSSKYLTERAADDG